MWPFSLKREPSRTERSRERRYIVATPRELSEAKRRELARAASVQAQLAVYNAVTTPEQRQRDAEQFFASKAKARGAIREGRG